MLRSPSLGFNMTSGVMPCLQAYPGVPASTSTWPPVSCPACRHTPESRSRLQHDFRSDALLAGIPRSPDFDSIWPLEFCPACRHTPATSLRLRLDFRSDALFTGILRSPNSTSTRPLESCPACRHTPATALDFDYLPGVLLPS